MNAAFFTVYYNTPVRFKKQLSTDCGRLGLPLHADDVSGEKKGYAESLNGLIEANFNSYDIFFLGNPDIHMAGIPRDELHVAAEHFDIWGYAMKQNGKIYYGGELDKWRMSGGLIKNKPVQRFFSCDFVSGSLMAVTKDVFRKIGYLDESFFMYYEDVEFCTRARRKGLRVGIDSEQWYEHFESSDANPEKKKYLARNRMKFLWKYGSFRQKMYELARLPITLVEEGKYLI